MKRPCIDICRYDEATDWCLGCGMTRKERKTWKREPILQQAIAAALPVRLAALALAGRPTGEAAEDRKRKKT